MNRLSRGRAAVVSLAALSTFVALPPSPSYALDARHNAIVSANPANNTPDVLDEPGSVRALALAGGTMVAGGQFTTVQNAGSTTPLARTRLFSFDIATGQVTPNFAPNVDDIINAVVISTDGLSAYIGGEFKNVNGVPRVSLAKLDLATGQLDAVFNQPKLDGRVFSIKKANGKLYIAGSFAHVGAAAVRGVAALDPTTGALDPSVNLDFAGVHNGGVTTIRKIDITPDGTRLVAVGNFKTVAGLDRQQVALIDLTGPTASVADWQTNRFKVPCRLDFDTVMHDVAFSPDGSYFVIGTTGSYNFQTLCDASSRWETGAAGSALQPTWSNSTGGDTIWSVAITGTVVYLGGHFRWQNNPFAGDKPGPGAVPREGLTALDPITGMPFDWNPGRTTGEGAFDLLATSTGLWVGHDTNFIGKEFHRKLAFFPLAGGKAVPNPSTGAVPSRVYRFGKDAPAALNNALYRVNAGGPQIAATDGGPVWAADTNVTPSANHNAGSTTKSWPAIPTVSTAVPTTTPKAIFKDERVDPATGTEMAWQFSIPADTPIEVRLYFANQDPATQLPEQRVFDITLEGAAVRSKYDIVKDVGHRVGTMQSFVATSDGSVGFSFVHHVGDPTLSGVEIISTCGYTTQKTLNDSANRHNFDGASAGPSFPVFNQGTAWSQARGAFMLSGTLYTGWADGHLCARAFNGTGFGPQKPINLYNNKWVGTTNNVSAGDLANTTAMFFANNRLYYTVKGKTSLFYRYFSPQANVLGAELFVASPSLAGISFSQVGGMFLSPDPAGTAKTFLYFTQKDTGNLSRITWNGTAPVPFTAIALSGPGIDATNWVQQALALYVAAGEVAPNVKPRAFVSSKCTGLECAFTSAGSGDQDGTITSYSWTFGDGSTATGARPTHTYAAEGTYPVTLTVTDDAGATATATRSLTVAPVNQLPIASFTVSCLELTCQVDGGASSDPDGTVDSYAWDFGDTGTASGNTAEHTYAVAGAYTITLTVTDNRNGTGTTTRNVNVAPPALEITFVGSNTATVNAASATVNVPAGVVSGDALLVSAASNSNTTPLTGPSGSGWTLLQTVTAGTGLTSVWSKVASSGDAGSAITFSTPSAVKLNVTVLAYHGTSGSNPVSVFGATAETVSRSTHTTPTVTVPTDGSWVVSLWSDKSSGTTSLSTPAGQTQRVHSCGTGPGHVCVLATDGNAPVTAGSAGGLTTTADASSASDTMWTIVLTR